MKNKVVITHKALDPGSLSEVVGTYYWTGSEWTGEQVHTFDASQAEQQASAAMQELEARGFEHVYLRPQFQFGIYPYVAAKKTAQITLF